MNKMELNQFLGSKALLSMMLAGILLSPISLAGSVGLGFYNKTASGISRAYQAARFSRSR